MDKIFREEAINAIEDLMTGPMAGFFPHRERMINHLRCGGKLIRSELLRGVVCRVGQDLRKSVQEIEDAISMILEE